MARVTRLYREHAAVAVRTMVEAATAGDRAETARAAHALKSMSGNIGARAVSDMAGRIEAAARERDVAPAEIEGLHRRLLATLELLDHPDGAPTDTESGPQAAPVTDQTRLLQDLRLARERGEFSVVYQRQVDRDGEATLGVEALLRWNHPTRGVISPALFIPLAEQNGLIRDITGWVLDRAVAETKDLGGLTVAINASAVEFGDPEFADEVAVILARHDFDPRRLEVEITETAILSEGDEVRRSMDRLHALGVKIALDDFGVGYSSLSHLQPLSLRQAQDRPHVRHALQRRRPVGHPGPRPGQHRPGARHEGGGRRRGGREPAQVPARHRRTRHARLPVWPAGLHR